MTEEIPDMDKFNKLMYSSKDRIIKLELLDSYSDAFNDEKKEMKYFLKHKKLSPEFISKATNEWYKETKRLEKNGVKFIRIHIVGLPITDYIKFELESYKLSEKSGEIIYLMDRKDFKKIKPKSKIKVLDFLVFDDTTVALHKFKVDKKNNAKKFIGTDFISNKNTALKYIKYWEAILKKSIRLKKFIQSLNI